MRYNISDAQGPIASFVFKSDAILFLEFITKITPTFKYSLEDTKEKKINSLEELNLLHPAKFGTLDSFIKRYCQNG